MPTCGGAPTLEEPSDSIFDVRVVNCTEPLKGHTVLVAGTLAPLHAIHVRLQNLDSEVTGLTC